MVSRPALPTLPPFLIPKVSLPVACEAPPKLAQLTPPLPLPFPLPGMSFVTGDRLYVAAQTERSLTIPSPNRVSCFWLCPLAFSAHHPSLFSSLCTGVGYVLVCLLQ